MKQRRIGVFGGTFDPVHLGHIRLAEVALNEITLDEIVFLPAALPPHKDGEIADFKHRFAMLKIVCNDVSEFSISTLEEMLPKPSFTIDTLAVLQKHHDFDGKLYFIMGSDSFLDISTWKEYGKVLENIHLILACRYGYDNVKLESVITGLGYRRTQSCWVGSGKKKNIYMLQKLPPEVSSSGIRDTVQRQGNCDGLANTVLDPGVAAYIDVYGLYR